MSKIGQAFEAAVERIKRIFQALWRDGLQLVGKPVPLWRLLLVAVLGAFALWRMYGNGDQAPKRWKSVNEETPSKLYNSLVNPCGLASPRQLQLSHYLAQLQGFFGFASPAQDHEVVGIGHDASAGDSLKTEHLPPFCNDDGGQHHDWNKPHVAVYTVAAKTPALPTLRDLGDRGQARAISLLEKTSPNSWTQLRDALSETGAASPGEKDPFQFDRVLVTTVTKGAQWDPGDRMVWTRVFVQPINFSYASYTVAATDNQTIKVSSVEAVNSRKFSADIGLTVPGLEGPKASIGPSDEHTVKTTSDISAQYEKLGIDIVPDFLRIIRESETGGDVVGNTTVSLSVVTDPLTIYKRSPEDNRQIQKPPLDDDLVLLVKRFDDDPAIADQNQTGDPATGHQKQTGDPLTALPQVPVPHCALLARVWMLYEERRVDSGRESYDESRQAVTLLREAEDKQDLEIMPADEVSPAVWSLHLCAGDKCDGKSDELLTASVKNGQPRRLVFNDYGEAVKLAHWLKVKNKNNNSASRYTFNYPDSDKRSIVPVKNTDDDCNKKAKAEEIASRR
jgi:hypothetical protein